MDSLEISQNGLVVVYLGVANDQAELLTPDAVYTVPGRLLGGLSMIGTISAALIPATLQTYLLRDKLHPEVPQPQLGLLPEGRFGAI